ncbi:hypothetical protein DUNSADRAFT_5203 [Dunaliella salina]|uniref:Uncharacterized protein n=1 Tax=Dunaliella salina TaxID=3046 RepID=A0ABQ7FUH1_DUNSA|nr:hypothetical protein DUNSADRAFT_5203 [Dunaliella salina]|eukprot:KAF5826053.1 hypothetical protein DUNSADRAFT_5203 [Dunaliella salina]
MVRRYLANACLASGSSIQGFEQRLIVLSLSSGSSAGCPENIRAHHTHAGSSAHHNHAFAPGAHASSALPQGLFLQHSTLPLPCDKLRKTLNSMQLPGLQCQQHFSASSKSAANHNPSSKPQSPALMDKVETALKPRLEQAFRLHATAQWQQHRFKVYAVGSLFAVWVTWSLAQSIASVFIDVCSLAAQWGLLVMGAPLAGSDMRAYVMTGGGAYLSKKATLRPKIRSRRIQMIFPLHGSERSGMVSVEAKKRKGRHVFKLLAVDVRQGEGLSTSSQPARIYLQGNDVIYSRGDVLEQMRRPFLQV